MRLLTRGDGAHLEIRHAAGGILDRVMAHKGQQIASGELIAVLDTAAIDRQIAELRQHSNAVRQQLDLVRQEARSFSDLLEKRLASRAKVESLEQHVAALEQDAAGILARTAEAERQLSRMELRAPIGGTLDWVTPALPGTGIDPGGSVARIAPHPRRLTVEAMLPLEAARKVVVGTQMSVWLSALSWLEGRPLQARIVRIGHETELAAAVSAEFVPVRMELDTASAALAGRIALVPGLRGGFVLRQGQRTFVEQLLEPVLRNLIRPARV